LYGKKPLPAVASEVASGRGGEPEIEIEEDEINALNTRDVFLAVKLACLMRN
jgi:hypothetical protein